MPGVSDLHLLATGSGSTVYRAWQPALKRWVAVKVLGITLADGGARDRFVRECSAVGRLTGHPNIVTVLTAGVTRSSRPYLTMDLFEQGSLADVTRLSGPVSVELVLRYGVKLAGALETAHRAGILHRDLKPENVLISAFGEPGVADFGIATLGEARGTTEAVVATHAAPEVLDGRPATPAADVYGLGSTLWTALAGRLPFGDGSEGPLKMMLRVLREPVPPIGRSDVPPAVEEALRWAMAKEPAERAPTGRAGGGTDGARDRDVTSAPLRSGDAATAAAGSRASPSHQRAALAAGATTAIASSTCSTVARGSVTTWTSVSAEAGRAAPDPARGLSSTTRTSMATGTRARTGSTGAAYGVKLSGALETAHRAGILHRDLKPENVLLSRFGEPGLADFGMATLGEVRGGTEAFTPTHAAPEVLEGQQATTAADVYSLGSTLWTALAGRLPFGDGDEGPAIGAAAARRARPRLWPRPEACARAGGRAPAPRADCRPRPRRPASGPRGRSRRCGPTAAGACPRPRRSAHHHLAVHAVAHMARQVAGEDECPGVVETQAGDPHLSWPDRDLTRNGRVHGLGAGGVVSVDRLVARQEPPSTTTNRCWSTRSKG